MAVNWTPAQKEAVNANVSNILVSAAAGSGKTQVLTGRVIRRILSGETDINRLLIMTFTRAAAAQMRERIGKALRSEIDKNPENPISIRQLSLLNCAKITTIDSFCMDVVKSNFFVLGLKPDFRIADADELEILAEEASLEAVEELYNEGNSDFLHLTDCYSDKRGDAAIIDMALSLLNFSESMPYPVKWICDVCEEYNLPDDESFLSLPSSVFTISCVISHLKAALDMLIHGKSLCSEANGLEKYISVFDDDIIFLSAALKAAEGDISAAWNDLFNMICTRTYRNLPPVRGADATDKETVSNIRKAAKDHISSAGKLLYAPWQECAASHKAAYPIVRAIKMLALRILDILDAKKAERSLLSFSDVAHKCIELLGGEDGTPTDIADAVMQQYDEIYIDEYQDSNALQELIFSLISRKRLGNPNIFMVGDMKQSIYGFRQTSPELFMEKSRTYKNGENEKYRKIQLTQNFRSRESVLNFVNSFFEKVMSAEFGGVDYTHEERLVPGAKFSPAPLQFEKVEFLITDTKALEIPDEESPKNAQLEARMIARKIQSLIDSKTPIYDAKEGTSRPIKYSDIVILMRAKTAAPIFAREFQASGIPTFCEAGDSFFASTEIRVFLSLLQVLDNPLSDIPLISLMRSPIFAFDEDELARIKLKKRRGSFYDAVLETAKAEGAFLSEKCKKFLNKIKLWRDKSKHLPLSAFIWFLFEDSGYMDFVSALPGGDVRSANLRMLFDKAVSYEKTSFKGLFNFIVFVEKLSARNSQSEAKTVDESLNLVKIMTIHKSKGLEFPVVFLSNTSSKFSKKSVTGNMLLHKKLGIGLKVVEPKLGIQYDLQSKTALAQSILDDEMHEELRVLYVALTRATEKLIITGVLSTDSARKNIARLAAAPGARNLLGASSFLEILCASLMPCGVENFENINFSVHIQKEYIDALDSLTSADALTGIESDVSAETDRRLSYKYPFYDLCRIPTKVSVTELKRLLNEDGDVLNLYTRPSLHPPQFDFESEDISPAKRGSIIHLCMQYIDFKKVETLADIDAFLFSLVNEGVLTHQMADAVSREKIYAFLHSDIGRKIKNANRVEREVPFTLPVPASLLTGDKKHFNETVTVQGIIDCFFFEGDNITLVDYKSDRVKSKADILEKYRLQLDFYAMALEKKFFRKTYKKYIYLFDNDDIIEL